MDINRRRVLVALLAALLLMALPSLALAEWEETGTFEISEPPALPVQDGEEVTCQPVEPAAEALWDEGEAELVLEQDGSLEYGTEQPEASEAIPLAEDLVSMDETGLTYEASDEVAAPEEGSASEEAALPDGAGEEAIPPRVDAGYAAVAANSVICADAELTRPIGVFPEDAAVYVEATERDGAALKIWFDTEEARAWAGELSTGYASAWDALGYTEAESAALVQALAANPRTRALGDALIPCARFEAGDYGVMPAGEAVGLGVAARSPEEIQAFANANPAYRNQVNIYAVAATDAPYAVGKLSAVNQQSALNLINQVRYIAGLNADVGLLPGQEDAMAAAALVLRLNGGLSHTPPRPAELAEAGYDALYWQGFDGAGHANIATGYTATGSILAYMADSDSGNIANVGHRRWILNPRMSGTVFGANGRFSAMYAHDVGGAGEQTRVAWPAQQMPLQYFSASDPWSLSYGRALDAAQVQVSLIRVSDGRIWRFSQAEADGYFNVDNSFYGQPGCVIFRPDGLDGIADGEQFNVAVTDGATQEVTRYTVRFFNLDLSAANPFDALDVTAIKQPDGNAVAWNVMPGATGYYVCRRAGSGNYQIVADVAATEYMDVNVFGDLTYSYQVFAHTASVTSRSAVSVEAKPLPPESVALNASGTVMLYLNATLPLTATFAPANASAALTWDSSKTGVATVDENGLVTPLKKGATIISVRTDNGKTASVKVKVVSPPKPQKVLLSASGTLTLTVGETVQLSATVQPAEASAAVRWSSSKGRVATVDGGLVTAVGEGTATVTAKAVNGKKAKVKIRVVDPYKPDRVALNVTGTVTLKVGQTLKLEAAVAPDTARTTLTWTSSRKKVASVDGGNVTALKKGATTVTVKTANGKKARVKIKVVN